MRVARAGSAGRDAEHRHRRDRPGWLALAVVLLVLVVGLSSDLLKAHRDAGPTPVREGPASFAPSSPGYSHATADVQDSPLGRAVALYQQGTGVEFFDTPQALLLSADATATRRLGLADGGGGPASQDDPAPMLLAPNGRFVAVGAHGEPVDTLTILGLLDGRLREVPVASSREVQPLAWSPDSADLAFTDADGLHVLSMASGAVKDVPLGTVATGAAFSPASKELAVELDVGGLVVLDLVSGTQRQLRAGGPERTLAPGAWSPDGRLLALSPPFGRRVDFVPADGSGRDAPAGFGIPGTGDGYFGGFVAWSAADRVVSVTSPGTGGEGGDATLVETDTSGGSARVLTSISTNDGNEVVWRMQLASELVRGAYARPQSAADTGPRPLRWSLIATLPAAASAGVLVLLGGGARRAWGRRRSRAN